MKKLPQNEKRREVFLLPLLPQLVFIAFCVEGFTDLTLIDYGLPKFCEVQNVKLFEIPWYYRQRLPVKIDYSSSTHRQVHRQMLIKQACELPPSKDRINAWRCSLNVSREPSTDRDIVF